MNNEQDQVTPVRRKKRRKRKRRMSVAKMVLLDLLAIAVGLNVFALFHHVLDYYGIHPGGANETPVVLATLPPLATPVPVAVTSAPDTENGGESAEPTPEPTPARVYSGMWGEKFADKFTDGEIIRTEDSYQSPNVNITVQRFDENNITYFVADVYISDLRYLRSVFAGGKFNGGIEDMQKIAQDNGAILALSGDHYYGRGEGMVIRNGELWRQTRFADICVLLQDGSMVTMTNAEADYDNIIAASPYQVWSFGPELLDDEGHAMTKFNSVVLKRNPRSAIGYVEPGHYYFVEVDGRNSGSLGMTMEQLSQLFEDLGCQSAYNLDGGQSAGIVWQGSQISYRYNRYIPDMICIIDDAQESEG